MYAILGRGLWKSLWMGLSLSNNSARPPTIVSFGEEWVNKSESQSLHDQTRKAHAPDTKTVNENGTTTGSHILRSGEHLKCAEAKWEWT